MAGSVKQWETKLSWPAACWECSFFFCLDLGELWCWRGAVGVRAEQQFTGRWRKFGAALEFFL